jgi:hypothetical protein
VTIPTEAPVERGIVVDRSGSVNSMLNPLQQGLMAIHTWP